MALHIVRPRGYGSFGLLITWQAYMANGKPSGLCTVACNENILYKPQWLVYSTPFVAVHIGSPSGY